QPLEPCDVGLDVLRVEAEVLEAVVRVRVAGAEPLVRARARDVDGEAVLAGAAHETVAEHARLVVDDLEAERGDVPLGGLARVRRLQVDVVDPIGHGCHLRRTHIVGLLFPRLPPDLRSIGQDLEVDNQSLAPYEIDDAMVADAESEKLLGTLQLYHARRFRIVLQTVDFLHNLTLRVCRSAFEFLYDRLD